MKTKKNTTKKSVKPVYTVDITSCKDENDVALAIALGKHNAGLPLTDDNLRAVVNYAVDMVFDCLTPAIVLCECTCKKMPWYKRLWRKLTGRK